MMRRPRSISPPTIIYVPIILIILVLMVVEIGTMAVVRGDAEYSRHRVGNDNARTNDLFRIARKEAIRVVGSIGFSFSLSTYFNLAFARMASP
jgi:hypothetical protein